MAEPIPIYDELSIRLHPEEGGCYRAIASAADGATASSTFSLPFTKTELDNFVLRVGRHRLSLRSYRSTQMEEARRFGSRLFEALIVAGVRDVFRSARAAAEKERKGLRLTICLTETPELMDVPWEFLYDRPRFLSQSIYSPIARSLDLAEVPAPYPVDLPLKVLGMVSSPRAFESLDVEREKTKLIDALAPLCAVGLVTIEWLEKATLQELDETISRRQDTHVFHYIGHGAYDPRTQGGILVLETEHGDPHEVSGEELGLLLQDERSLRLAVLNSCEGARSSQLDPFSGVASSLVQYGFPAVIGMQFEITDSAAIAFAGRLYGALTQGLPVDAALAQARKAIFAAGNDIEFGTPVLFLRGNEAHLFEVLDPPPPGTTAEELPPEPTDSLTSELELELVDDPLIEHSNEKVALRPPPVPSSLAWLPKPWQEWLEDGWSNLLKALRAIPNRRLVISFILMLIVATVLTTVFGHKNASGNRENTLGSILAGVSFLGLIAVGIRVLYNRGRNRWERLRDWWTGSS